MTPDDLKSFSQEIAEAFNRREIRAPVHLEGGNETQLVEIFDDVKPEDWVLCSWRSMSKALLKGVPREEVKAAIMKGRSITLNFPQHRFLTSAIAGGTCPIAVGLGMGIKMANGNEQVWTFVGDMVAESGIFYECVKYAGFHNLPCHWIIEDNGKSVVTDTRVTWFACQNDLTYRNTFLGRNVHYFKYHLPLPHSGAGKRINF